MKNLYIRFSHREAVETRKQLLSSEINLMEILKNLKKYKRSRNRIKILKLKFKGEISALKTDMAFFKTMLPEEDLETETQPKTSVDKSTIDKKIKKDLTKKTEMQKEIQKKPKNIEDYEDEEFEQDTAKLENELKAIQEKLASLG